MRNITEITELLNELDSVVADELEDQDLDFTEWDTGSLPAAIAHVIEMAICMANGGGAQLFSASEIGQSEEPPQFRGFLRKSIRISS